MQWLERRQRTCGTSARPWKMTGPIQGERTTASADICTQPSLLSPADRTCFRLSLTSLDYLENVKHWAQIIYCFILSHYFMLIKFLRIGIFDPCTEHTLSRSWQSRHTVYSFNTGLSSVLSVRAHGFQLGRCG